NYPTNTEPVNVTLTMYGNTVAMVDLYLDGQVIKNESVSLNGFVNITFSLEPLAFSPGSHTIKAVLSTGGLTSVKETGIVYGSDLPDLTTGVSGQGSVNSKDNTIQLTATIINQGKTASPSTIVSLYDGNDLINTLNVSGLNPGESAEAIYNWNVLGKAGAHTINAAADAGNAVREFNENNNTASVNITVPKAALDIATGQGEYKANEDVGRAVNIANLSSDKTYENIKLDAGITGSSGSAVFNKTDEIQLLAPASLLSYGFNWNTGVVPPGDYTLTGKLLWAGNGAVIVEGKTAFFILSTPSLSGNFSLSKDTVIQGFDLNINYTLKNNGNIDLNGGEVKAEFIHAGGSDSVKDYANALPSLNILKETTGRVSIDKLDIEPGDYTVRLAALAEGMKFVIGELPLKVLPPLEVTKGISMQPRVLALLDKAEEDDKGKGEKGKDDYAETFVTDILNQTAPYYKIVRDKKDFKEEMRKGLYNTYILAGKKPLEDHLDEELTERINSGDGLILFNYEKIEDEKFRELTGVKSKGHLSKKTRTLTLMESSITQPGTLSITGKAQKLEIKSGNAVTAGVTEEKGKPYPMIIINRYGKGKVVLFAFDISASAEKYGSSLYAGLMGDAVNYSAPEEALMLPSYPAAIEISLTSLDGDFDLKVKEKPSTNGILLTYPAAVTSEDSIAWEFKLTANSMEKLLYLTKIESIGGTYTNTTTVEYLKNNAYELYNTYPIEITAQSLTELEMDILNRLAGINGAIAQRYSSIINAPLITREDIQKAIQDLIDITESLNALGGDADAIRIDIDSLIKIFGRRWVEAAALKDEDED
ncbi:MAG: hypothetical protein HY786_07870, partial [Deltaproteobacteria bacterium]|nr:hypothetical protein [Deltaproteobacteria bacterium]